jgi:DNA helicase II / ATP-dependent DNA helicase PcrA
VSNSLTFSHLVQHGDIAILLRSAFLSLLIEKALANAGIPYRMVGGRRFFDRVEVRILLDYLRTISHPDNTSALLAIINTPTRKVGDTTIKELTRIAEINKESLWSTIQKALDGSSPLDKKLSKPAEQGLNDLVSLIKKARQKMETMIPEQTPAKLIEHVIKSLGYQDYLKKQYREDHEERWENVKELLTQASDATLQFNPIEDQLPQIDGVAQEQVEGPQEVLSRFLANVVLSTEKDTEDGETKPRVTISTIHSAKGLEWPVVFVPAIYEGSIPHSRAEDTNEERRLLYVALTRAQALLYMTFPVVQSRDESESILSQFLPSKITHMISQTGPVFNDKVIGDIATITRRPPASQEDLVRGLQSIKESESQYDDLWPVDGAPRRSHLVDREYPSFYLQPGQSLSDALKPSGQKSNFSTISYSAGTTMTNATSFSTANLSTTFTTAGHHLKNTPQLPEKPKPTLTKSASDTSSMTTKRPSLVKTISSQGSIASFFSNSTVKSKSKQEQEGETVSIIPQDPDSEAELEVLKERSRSQRQSQSSPQYLPPLSTKSSSLTPSTTNTDNIPQDLLKHRLINPNLLLKRPRSALDQATSSEINKTKRRNYHHCFSSDPAEEPKDDEEASKNPNTSSSLASTSTSTSTPSIVNANSTFPNARPPQIRSSIMHTTTTTMSSMSNSASINNFNSTNNNISLPLTTNPNTRLVGLNTLQGLQRLSGGAGAGAGAGMTNSLNTTTLGRKTLGVRRSMNGWDSRKNK